MVCWTTDSDNQYYICRHARGNNKRDCSAAKCKDCYDGEVEVKDGKSVRAARNAMTKKSEDPIAKEKCLTGCHHDEKTCFQVEGNWCYVEKSYNDKLRKDGKGDAVITNRCCNPTCGNPILLESEGGDPVPVNPRK
jgi:hypothetical protein